MRPAESSRPAAAGRTFGRYELVERIGAGALTEAWRAKSFGVEGFEKTLVIKILDRELGLDPDFVAAFVEQAKLAVRLSHANVVQVFDLGRVEEAGEPSYFLAMEHVAGRDLHGLVQSWHKSSFQPPVGFGLYVACELAKALDHAHRRRNDALEPLGAVHGDVSAKNVLLSWDGEVKLGDFCIARALHWAARGRFAEHPRMTGKIAALSPEVARGEVAGPASDVFALGALLYELLSGVHPFGGSTARECLTRLERGGFVPLGKRAPGLPAGLCRVVDRALSVDPRARQDSSARLYEELMAERYAAGARYGASELAELLEVQRTELPSVEPMDEIFERTRTGSLRPNAEKLASVPPKDVEEREPSVLGSLGELKNERELTLLLARLGRGFSDAARTHAELTLTRYGGRLITTGSGEIGAVFGLGIHDSLDTENAVRAGLVLVRSFAAGSDISLGVTVARLAVADDAALIEDDRVKAAIASARRLAQQAPRRVVASPEAARNLRGRFELSSPGGGKLAAKLPVLVGERKAIEGASERFVGRKAELRRLGEALKAASHRKLQVMSISGPHGVGKTRLVQEAAERLTRGAFAIACYVARCLPRGRQEPHGAIVSMLRTLCGVREGDPPAAIAAVEPRLRALGLVDEEVSAVLGALGAVARGDHHGSGALGAAVARMFASLAEDKLHIFVWDDAHELDDDSSELLVGVAERLANTRVVLLFAGRPLQEAGYRKIPGHVELVLDELDEPDLRKLIAERIGVLQAPEQLVSFVAERAGGHPMFVEELLREAKDSAALEVRDGKLVKLALDGVLSVPRPLRALIVDRVRRLPDRERDLLVACAILGSPVDVSVLAAMLDLPLGKVNALADALAQKQLLTRQDPVSLGFSTTMLPEVVLDELDPDARLELHSAAANAYAMVLGERTEQEAARIAHHFAEAGERLRAAGYYATSGYYHLASRRLERAAQDFRRALELADWRMQDPYELARWIASLGHAVRHVRAGGQLPDLVQRLWLHVQSDASLDRELAIRMTIDLALVLGSLSRYRDAQRLLASASAGAAEWSDLRQAALIARAEIAARQGEFKAALEALDSADATPGDALDEHRRLLARAQALGVAGRYQEALGALQRAAALSEGAEPVLCLERAKVTGLIHGLSGDWARCAAECESAAEQARELGLPHEVAIHLHNQGDALMRIDELPRAYAVLARSLSVAERIGAERMVNLNHILLAYLDALNGAEGAQKLLGQKIAHAEAQKWTWDALSGRTLLGKLLARRGDVVGARRELSLARRMAEATSNQLVVDDCARALDELGGSTHPAKD
jgi:serine/threonine protein kinase/tetratricopeptide (TPR) repeat protein